MELEELRRRRRELQAEDDAVSYVRRVAQGRADLTRAELARRTSVDVAPAEHVRDVLSDRLLGASGRPPRPVEDWSGHPRAEALDQLCAEHGFGQLLELDADRLAALANALDQFEATISAERRQVEAELDTLSDELVEVYREQGSAR